jgi:hypothetical protein
VPRHAFPRLIHHRGHQRCRLRGRQAGDQPLAQRFGHQDVALAVDAGENVALGKDGEIPDVAQLFKDPEHPLELPRECLGPCLDPSFDPPQPLLDLAGPNGPPLVGRPVGAGMAGVPGREFLQPGGLALGPCVQPVSALLRRPNVQGHEARRKVTAEPGAPGAPRTRQRDLRQDDRRLLEVADGQPKELPVLGQDGRPALA